jgi:hypothetical protein
MKAVVILLSIVAFVACLILGIQAGNQSTPSPTQTATSTPLPSPASSEEQRTVVLIVADDMQAATPRLVSVWVVLYRPDIPLMSFLPIYPHNTLTSPSKPPDLAGIFSLNPDQTPSGLFANALRSYRFEWTGYIMTDEMALAKTVNWLQGIQLSSNTANGDAAIASLINPWEDPLGALKSQQNLLEALCVKVATLTPEANWLELAGTLLPQHLHTSLSLEQAIKDWKQLASGTDPIHCDIPIE